MHLPFSYVRCPSCGSTFEISASIAPPDNGVSQTYSSQTDQAGYRGAMFTPSFVLHSWKDISAYTALSVRTVQRWEHDYGFPVHRPNQRDHNAVFAFPEEINEWLHRTPIRSSRKPALGNGNRTER